MTNRFTKYKLILILGCTGLLCAFLTLGIRMRHSEIMGMSLVDPSQLDSLLAARRQISYSDTLSICSQGTPLPYTPSDHTIYFPQNSSHTHWEGSLTPPPGYTLYLTADDALFNKTQSLKENHSFSVYLIGQTDYVSLRLLPTGLPVINIQTLYEEEPEEIDYYTDPDRYVFESQTNYYGLIDVWDPVHAGNGYTITSANVKYHVKGATTAVFEKKSYSIHLKDDAGNPLKCGLLGMRKDDDWKLNSLVTDSTYLREMTASQLWTEFAQTNAEVQEYGAVMQYAELLLDNEYCGIYGLVEPIDSKKLGLDENDYLYKSVDEQLPDEDAILESAENGWRVAQSMRIMYPDDIKDYPTAWYPLLNHYAIFRYYDPETYNFENAAAHIYLSNLCDRTIFNLVTSASDNSFKNVYYAVDVENTTDSVDTPYRIREIPWDLDYTFGNTYSYTANRFTVFDTDYTHTYLPPVWKQLSAFSPEQANPKLVSRWHSCRRTFLSTDHILSLFEANQQSLLSSGAFLREQERWPEQKILTDLQELKTFQTERMNWLDTYITSGMPGS